MAHGSNFILRTIVESLILTEAFSWIRPVPVFSLRNQTLVFGKVGIVVPRSCRDSEHAIGSKNRTQNDPTFQEIGGWRWVEKRSNLSTMYEA